MKIVRNYQGKTTMSGREFDVETIVKRYPIVEKKAKEMYEEIPESSIQKEIIDPLREIMGEITSEDVLEELKQEGLIKKLVIKISEALILKSAMQEVVEKGNITFVEALSNVEATPENKEEVLKETYSILSEEIKKEMLSSAIMGLFFPEF